MTPPYVRLLRGLRAKLHPSRYVVAGRLDVWALLREVRRYSHNAAQATQAAQDARRRREGR